MLQHHFVQVIAHTRVRSYVRQFSALTMPCGIKPDDTLSLSSMTRWGREQVLHVSATKVVQWIFLEDPSGMRRLSENTLISWISEGFKDSGQTEDRSLPTNETAQSFDRELSDKCARCISKNSDGSSVSHSVRTLYTEHLIDDKAAVRLQRRWLQDRWQGAFPVGRATMRLA